MVGQATEWTGPPMVNPHIGDTEEHCCKTPALEGFVEKKSEKEQLKPRRKSREGEGAQCCSRKAKVDQDSLDLATKKSPGNMFPVVKVRLQ